MIYFKVPYNIDYYTSKTFRFVFNERQHTLSLIDSYETKNVTISYDEIISAGFESVSVGDENPGQILTLRCAENTIFYFSVDKIHIREIEKYVYSKIGNEKITVYLILASGSNYSELPDKLNTIINSKKAQPVN